MYIKGFISYSINYKLNYNINYMRFRPFFVPASLNITTIPKTARPPANPQRIKGRDLQLGRLMLCPRYKKKAFRPFLSFPCFPCVSSFHLKFSRYSRIVPASSRASRMSPSSISSKSSKMSSFKRPSHSGMSFAQ